MILRLCFVDPFMLPQRRVTTVTQRATTHAHTYQDEVSPPTDHTHAAGVTFSRDCSWAEKAASALCQMLPQFRCQFRQNDPQRARPLDLLRIQLDAQEACCWRPDGDRIVGLAASRSASRSGAACEG